MGETDRIYTFEQVQEAGNDPEVAFGPETKFRLGSVPVRGAAPLRSYLDEGDYKFAYSVLDMILTILEQPKVLPPVVADASEHVEDGAHRLAAYDELGIDEIPAFIAIPA